MTKKQVIAVFNMDDASKMDELEGFIGCYRYHSDNPLEYGKIETDTTTIRFLGINNNWKDYGPKIKYFLPKWMRDE